MTASAAGISCQAAGVILVRATTDPGGLLPSEDPDLSRGETAEPGRAWLAQAWQRADVREAIRLASPALSRQIDQTLRGAQGAVQVRRAVISLAAYLLRWQGRATPFGLFAGVAAVRAGCEPTVQWGQAHKITARADAAWLAAVAGQLERHPELLERLPVVANNAAFVRGDRLVIPGLPPDDRPGEIGPLEVSVRGTRPVLDAMQIARNPCRFGDLVASLSVRYPAVPPTRVRAMLTELVTQGALITTLHAPMTVPDALLHLITQLRAADVGEVSDLADLPAHLQAIHEDLTRFELAAPAAAPGTSRGAELTSRMRAVCDVPEQPIAVDVALDCDLSVPDLVIREAEKAASTLLRLTPYPFGYPHWKDYHVRFKSRYGIGALVPVSDLAQADTGLGLPAGCLGSAYPAAAPVLTPRDNTLLALAQQALLDSCGEVVLTEPVIQALTVGDPADRILPPRAELAFRIDAASCDAIADGEFSLVVTGVPRSGSSMAGRFADFLPVPDRSSLADTYRASDAQEANVIAAQLSFPARRRHGENVARTPRLLDRVISLSELHDQRDYLIGLDDLAVGANARELYLMQLSTGSRVEPRVLHALEAGILTPPLARFLAEVTTARCAVYTSFGWGAAARLPYLPRVRSGRTVLCSARWLLTTADLPMRSASWPAWDSALNAWRLRWRLPEAVMLGQGELRLPLSLDRQLHRFVLRARLDRAGEVELHEAPSHDDLAWAGRACEFLQPLRLTNPGAARRRTATPLRRRTEQNAGHLPGISCWLHAQIHGHPERQDEILAGHLPRLFNAWNHPPPWWYSRHRELTRPGDDQHLDLYLRLPGPEAYGDAATRVGQWAAGLHNCALVPHLRLCTYRPETGRFGHGPAMTAAEDVFAADSAAALAQITMAVGTGLPAQALAAASFVNLAVSYATTPTSGVRWLIRELNQDRGRPERSVRDTALKLADPRGGHAALRALPGGQSVLVAWQQRSDALAVYRTRLAAQRNPTPVLRSLLHLHHVRSLGVEPQRERDSNSLARAAALAWLAHGPGKLR
jgi:thiopeptide-type bacteriocin biosynthesis protein